jgi:4-alpha-glucanotransferase
LSLQVQKTNARTGAPLARSYRDGFGRRRRVPAATLERLEKTLAAPESPPPVQVVTQGAGARVERPAEIHTEDGAVERVEDAFPDDLPLGYHRLVDLTDDSVRRLIVTPPKCWVADDFKTWGWAAQLYATRSRASWGIGDLADLAELAEWSAGAGAGALVINPLHAARPGIPQQPSPYYPSSRCFKNPLYLRIEEVPGAGGLEDVDELARAGRDLNGARLIERDSVYRLKLAALERLWERFSGDPRFDSYLEKRDGVLGFATYAALAESHEGPPSRWPAGLRHAGASGVVRWRRAHEKRVRFHAWLQWLLDEQLGRAAASLPIVHDLAVGIDPDGADAWTWPDTFVSSARVGAPPDSISPAGQDWGVLAFDPAALQALAYEPFIQTVRANLAGAGGLRIDHVMGLWRLFLVPVGEAAVAGTYLRYPASDLLGILALESRRAKAFVVGEDLGTVEPRVRREMARRQMLSYRIMWFEQGRPEDLPRLALAAAGNHDLPTIAGVWTGSDGAARAKMGLTDGFGALEKLRDRLLSSLGLAQDAPANDVVVRAYARLARAPCAVLTATLEDALAVEERPNHPGTTAAWPNWSLALPATLEQIRAAPGPHTLGRILGHR